MRDLFKDTSDLINNVLDYQGQCQHDFFFVLLSLPISPKHPSLAWIMQGVLIKHTFAWNDNSLPKSSNLPNLYTLL